VLITAPEEEQSEIAGEAWLARLKQLTRETAKALHTGKASYFWDCCKNNF
jgi:hypothetical protein